MDSTLIFKIKGSAKPLFKIWVDELKKHYPNYLFEVKEEPLVSELVFAFAKGLEWVSRERDVKSEQTESKELLLLNMVSSNLNTFWSQEYILKQRREYKELSMLKTLSQFLKIDASSLKKIELLHKHLLKFSSELEDSDHEKKDKIIDLNQFKKHKNSTEGFKKTITDYLDALYFEKHVLLFAEILKIKVNFNLEEYFQNAELKKLIVDVELDKS